MAQDPNLPPPQPPHENRPNIRPHPESDLLTTRAKKEPQTATNAVMWIIIAVLLALGIFWFVYQSGSQRPVASRNSDSAVVVVTPSEPASGSVPDAVTTAPAAAPTDAGADAVRVNP